MNTNISVVIWPIVGIVVDDNRPRWTAVGSGPPLRWRWLITMLGPIDSVIQPLQFRLVFHLEVLLSDPLNSCLPRYARLQRSLLNLLSGLKIGSRLTLDQLLLGRRVRYRLLLNPMSRLQAPLQQLARRVISNRRQLPSLIGRQVLLNQTLSLLLSGYHRLLHLSLSILGNGQISPSLTLNLLLGGDSVTLSLGLILLPELQAADTRLTP